MTRDRYIRCFKDDAIMNPVEGHPGWIRCTLCGFTTQLIGYNAESVRRDFDAMHDERLEEEKNDGARYPNGHVAPLRKPGSSGGSSGRRRAKPMKVVPWYQRAYREV